MSRESPAPTDSTPSPMRTPTTTSTASTTTAAADLEQGRSHHSHRDVDLLLSIDKRGFFTAAPTPLPDEEDEYYSFGADDAGGDMREEERNAISDDDEDGAASAAAAVRRPPVEGEAERRRRRCVQLPPHAGVLITMMFMVGSFGVVEMVVGFISDSLALLADSFHMMSDLLSLIVGFAAMWLAAKRGAGNHKTYGWQRAEIIGGFANGVFLVSVCFYTLTEAIVRLIEGPPPLTDPLLVLIVGIIGLVINLIGMCMFCSHRSLSHHHGHSHSHGHNHVSGGNGGDDGGGSNVNLHGVFLHVLGDALGSLVVIGTALVYVAVPGGDDAWKPYIDPTCSIIFSIFILHSAVPLLRHTGHVLMQSVPKHLDLNALREELVALNGVHSVHELHVWQLTSGHVIGTVHMETDDDNGNDSTLHRQVKRTFCRYGVHRTTVQCELMRDKYSAARRRRHRSARSGRNHRQRDDNDGVNGCRGGDTHGSSDPEHSCCHMSSSSSSAIEEEERRDVVL